MIQLLMTALLFVGSAFGSIPPSDIHKETDALLALRLPPENRIAALRSLGPQAFSILERLNADREQNLQVRWRALTALGELEPQKALPLLQKGLLSPDWFQRNASLLALQFGARQHALAAAAKLMDDPSLIVRTSAVQVMTRFNGKEHEDLLWKKLYSSENFSHGQSLWIRKYIAKALVQIGTAKSETKFQKMLADADPEIREIALQRTGVN
jgi:HEAT repeat protein